jgi:hypothetical protein
VRIWDGSLPEHMPCCTPAHAIAQVVRLMGTWGPAALVLLLQSHPSIQQLLPMMGPWSLVEQDQGPIIGRSCCC